MVKAPECQPLVPTKSTQFLSSTPLPFTLNYISTDYPGLWILYFEHSGKLYIMKDTDYCNDVTSVCQIHQMSDWTQYKLPSLVIVLQQSNSHIQYKFKLCQS